MIALNEGGIAGAFFNDQIECAIIDRRAGAFDRNSDRACRFAAAEESAETGSSDWRDLAHLAP